MANAFKHDVHAARKLWVEALRSGEFKQADGCLCKLATDQRTIYGHCCLGVACELFDRNERHLEMFARADDEQGNLRTYDGADRVLPPIVQLWLGLRTKGGEFFDQERDANNALYDVNDAGAPFSDIASIIESAPLGLFIEELA